MSTKSMFGKKVGGIRVVSLTVKILSVFIILILVSSFATNFINLTLNRGEQIRLMNELLVKELKEIYTFASNQHDLYLFSDNLEESIQAIEHNASRELKKNGSMALGIKPDGTVFFYSGRQRFINFPDQTVLDRMETSRLQGQQIEGPVFPNIEGREFFGVYRYHERWNIYLLRLEDRVEFYQPTKLIFYQIGAIIILITLLLTLLGMFLMRYILRFVPRITEALMNMQQAQNLQLIDLSEAPDDEITYLGASFNALSSSISNLMTIFRTFVSQDIVQRAYKEREIRLEGTQKELAILFSDIKGFTFMTETLGNDIISLLNIHYDRAIRRIHHWNGIVGSIIGDALLCVFGTLHSGSNKSLDALMAAYEIQNIAQALRLAMTERKRIIEEEKGALSEKETQVYRAVLLEVGVGIDGGEVFYGNIGSTERMTNTVIGDNVNSSSRLEGLTRIYRVPVICSEFIRNEVMETSDRFRFFELDTVQVKGKTEGKKIYYPADTSEADIEEYQRFEIFEKGLQLYYKGAWKEAMSYFTESGVLPASVFIHRIEGSDAPEGWNGVWTMDSK